MRTSVISIVAIAGTVLASNPANQIGDGQVQWSSGSAAPPAYSTPAASSPASPVSSSAAAPVYGGSSSAAAAPSYGVSTTVVVSASASASSPVGAGSTVVPPLSSAAAPSYPAGNATVPLGTGTPGGVPTGKTTMLTTSPVSPTSAGAGSTSTGPAQVSGTNAAGVVEAQIGLTGAAFAGLLAFLA